MTGLESLRVDTRWSPCPLPHRTAPGALWGPFPQLQTFGHARRPFTVCVTVNVTCQWGLPGASLPSCVPAGASSCLPPSGCTGGESRPSSVLLRAPSSGPGFPPAPGCVTHTHARRCSPRRHWGHRAEPDQRSKWMPSRMVWRALRRGAPGLCPLPLRCPRTQRPSAELRLFLNTRRFSSLRLVRLDRVAFLPVKV